MKGVRITSGGTSTVYYLRCRATNGDFLMTLADATYNCQLSILGGVEEFLECCELDKQEVLREFIKRNQKPLVLMDISLYYHKNEFMPIFRKYIDIVMESDFISTNKSQRKIVIFKLKQQ